MFEQCGYAGHVSMSLTAPVFRIPIHNMKKKTVFRTNTSYQRWDEARKNWGMNINHTRYVYDICWSLCYRVQF